jgi:hypothetical protein
MGLVHAYCLFYGGTFLCGILAGAFVIFCAFPAAVISTTLNGGGDHKSPAQRAQERADDIAAARKRAVEAAWRREREWQKSGWNFAARRAEAEAAAWARVKARAEARRIGKISSVYNV